MESGRDLQSRAFVAGLLLVGGASVAWGLLTLLTGPSFYPPAVFAVALGASVLVVTLAFILPEAEEEEEPLGLRRSSGGSRLSVDDMKEYLDLLEQAEEKWLRHVTAVTQERAARASEDDLPSATSSPSSLAPPRTEGWAKEEPAYRPADEIPMVPPSRPEPAPIPSVARLPDSSSPKPVPGSIRVPEPVPEKPPRTHEGGLPPSTSMVPPSRSEATPLPKVEPASSKPTPASARGPDLVTSRTVPPTPEGSSPHPLPLQPMPEPIPRVPPAAIPAPHPATGPLAMATKPDDVVGAEVLAFYTAIHTGISRRPNETATAYVGRVRSQGQAGTGGTNVPTPFDVAESVADDLMEAHRTLSSRNLGLLGEAVNSRVNEAGKKIGIERLGNEELIDYASRLKAKSLSRPKPSLPPAPEAWEPTPTYSGGTLDTILHSKGPVPQTQSPGLTWALALYRGFLQNYFSTQDIEKIALEVETSSPGLPKASRSEDELITYSRLLKNAIVASQRNLSTPPDVNRVLQEFDQFVEMLRGTVPKKNP